MDINITKETLNVNKTVCEKKQVITVNSGVYCTAVNCYYLYRWGIKWNTLLSIT